jgi:small subunit ribosomal protein S8
VIPFKYGHGMYVLSTPKGIITDKQAKKEVVGGELLFSIW